MGWLLDEEGQQARYELVDCGLWIVGRGDNVAKRLEDMLVC